MESRATRSCGLFSHFTSATYIALDALKSINFDVEAVKIGIMSIKANVPKPVPYWNPYYVRFARPPKVVRFLLCERPFIRGVTFRYTYLQVSRLACFADDADTQKASLTPGFGKFEVNGRWEPPLPPKLTLLRPPIRIDNALGIWWGRTFSFDPSFVGAVVRGKDGLRNTVIPQSPA